MLMILILKDVDVYLFLLGVGWKQLSKV
jgi:hypothetical protein